jgi:hypothetical protein
MADSPLHNLNDLLAELEETAVTTSQGSFVKMEDVRRLLKDKADAATKAIADAADSPPPKTVEQARARAKEDPELLKQFAGRPQDAGRSIAAQEPQPASRP